MKAHSLTLLVVAVVGAFALFATPAEAGDRRKHYKPHNYHRGDGNDYSYYQRARHNRPRYHQRVRYVPAPVYYPRPAFQIGFAFGGGNGYGHCR
jgi:hypothetical protein